MPIEIWEKIPNQPSRYEVSNLGRIRTLAFTVGNRTMKEKILFSGLSQKGYPRINLNGTIRFIHNVVAEVFVQNPNNYPQVNHKDGNKLNNCADNLEWVTNQQNRDHAVANGLHSKEARPNTRKYTDQDAEEMAQMQFHGYSLRSIARLHNTTHAAIKKVLAR